MPVAALASTVIGVLTPYVAKGAAKLAEAAGEIAAKKAGQMIDALKDRWTKQGDVVATDMLQRYEKEPDTYKPVIEKILQERLDKDPALSQTLSALVAEMGGSVTVVQKLGEVEGEAIGADIRGEVRGKVTVDQSATKVKGKITGARIDRIG
jgi:hypothetical protein